MNDFDELMNSFLNVADTQSSPRLGPNLDDARPDINFGLVEKLPVQLSWQSTGPFLKTQDALSRRQATSGGRGLLSFAPKTNLILHASQSRLEILFQKPTGDRSFRKLATHEFASEISSVNWHYDGRVFFVLTIGGFHLCSLAASNDTVVVLYTGDSLNVAGFTWLELPPRKWQLDTRSGRISRDARVDHNGVALGKFPFLVVLAGGQVESFLNLRFEEKAWHYIKSVATLPGVSDGRVLSFLSLFVESYGAVRVVYQVTGDDKTYHNCAGKFNFLRKGMIFASQTPMNLAISNNPQATTSIEAMQVFWDLGKRFAAAVLSVSTGAETQFSLALWKADFANSLVLVSQRIVAAQVTCFSVDESGLNSCPCLTVAYADGTLERRLGSSLELIETRRISEAAGTFVEEITSSCNAASLLCIVNSSNLTKRISCFSLLDQDVSADMLGNYVALFVLNDHDVVDLIPAIRLHLASAEIRKTNLKANAHLVAIEDLLRKSLYAICHAISLDQISSRSLWSLLFAYADGDIKECLDITPITMRFLRLQFHIYSSLPCAVSQRNATTAILQLLSARDLFHASMTQSRSNSEAILDTCRAAALAGTDFTQALGQISFGPANLADLACISDWFVDLLTYLFQEAFLFFGSRYVTPASVSQDPCFFATLNRPTLASLLFNPFFRNLLIEISIYVMALRTHIKTQLSIPSSPGVPRPVVSILEYLDSLLSKQKLRLERVVAYLAKFQEQAELSFPAKEQSSLFVFLHTLLSCRIPSQVDVHAWTTLFGGGEELIKPLEVGEFVKLFDQFMSRVDGMFYNVSDLEVTLDAGRLFGGCSLNSESLSDDLAESWVDFYSFNLESKERQSQDSIRHLPLPKRRLRPLTTPSEHHLKECVYCSRTVIARNKPALKSGNIVELVVHQCECGGLRRPIYSVSDACILPPV